MFYSFFITVELILLRDYEQFEKFEFRKGYLLWSEVAFEIISLLF